MAINKHHSPKTDISIITSVFNTEPYLKRCIDSLIAQTFTNFELLLIDDGSSDNSPAICDAYASKDRRIKVIHTKNGGAARARNIGIEQATGEYIAIVDSDDYVSRDYLEKLFAIARESDSDISACGYNFLFEDGSFRKRSGKPTKQAFTNMSAIRDHFLENSILEPVFWNKLYRARIFKEHNIKLPEGSIYEDTRSLYRIYYYANKVTFVDSPLYFYLQRSGSVMNKGVQVRDIKLLAKIPEEAAEWCNSKQLNFTDELMAYESTGQINILNYMVDRSEIVERFWQLAVTQLRKNIFRYLKNHLISRKRKISIVLASLFGKYIYTVVRKKYNERGTNAH